MIERSICNFKTRGMVREGRLIRLYRVIFREDRVERCEGIERKSRSS